MASQTSPNKLKLASADSSQLKRKPQSFGGMAIESLRKDTLSIFAIGVVSLMALISLLAPIITSSLGVDPNSTNTANTFQEPLVVPYLKWVTGMDSQTAAEILGRAEGTAHWLGTDKLGRDQLARLMYGGRVSLGIAFGSALISMIFGVSIGAVAGYFGGIVDDLIMWMINTVLSVPTIYLLIIVSAIFKPSPLTLILFLGFLGWFGTARFMRGNVFRIKELDYTLAARSVGTPDWRIMLQHVIPNAIPVIIVVTAIQVGGLILTESVLSFLGLGVQPPTATWGSMLSRTRSLFFLDPAPLYLMLWPGILISIAVLCFYLIGDGLRDALDPMLKNKK